MTTAIFINTTSIGDPFSTSPCRPCYYYYLSKFSINSLRRESDLQENLKLSDDFLGVLKTVAASFTSTEQKRQGLIRGHWQGLMLTDKTPEWKYPACPFNRISARDLREKYCNRVGCEYEWKCQSYESS